MKKLLIIIILIMLFLFSGCMLRNEDKFSNYSNVEKHTGAETNIDIVTDNYNSVIILDESETKAGKETTTNNLSNKAKTVSVFDIKAFKELLQRERAGEKPSEEEIEEIKNYIDNSYCGIDLEYERASYDDRLKAAANGEFSYEYAITHVKESGKEYGWSRVLVWDDLKNLGLKDYYEYPRLTLQTVCDIINESDGFDEIIYKLAEVDKFFSAAGCTASGESVYRYDIKLTGEKCYEFIEIYPDRSEILYHKVINDPESKDYHNPYAVCIFSKAFGKTYLTPDSVKENLSLYVK